MLISERRRQKREEKQNGREAMKEARDLACSILNMTSEDLESLMGEEEDTVRTLQFQMPCLFDVCFPNLRVKNRASLNFISLTLTS